jgi:hypothetical protein
MLSRKAASSARRYTLSGVNGMGLGSQIRPTEFVVRMCGVAFLLFLTNLKKIERNSGSKRFARFASAGFPGSGL